MSRWTELFWTYQWTTTLIFGGIYASNDLNPNDNYDFPLTMSLVKAKHKKDEKM
jgi:hypothetical protein